MSKQKQTLIKCKQAIDNSQNVFGKKKKMHQADTDNFIQISGFISSQSNYKAEIFGHVWSEKEYSLKIVLCFALFFFLFYVAPSFFPKASSYSLKGIAEYNNILQLFFKCITLALEKKNTVHIIAFSLNTSSSCSFKKNHIYLFCLSRC